MNNNQTINLFFSKSDTSFELEDVDIEELEGDVRFAIKNYMSEVEEINGDVLDSELSIEISSNLENDSDETPESFNHETNTIGFKRVDFQVQNIYIDLTFSGKESNKLVDLYMEGLIEDVDANILSELQDKSFKLNTSPAPLKNKLKLTLEDTLDRLENKEESTEPEKMIDLVEEPKPEPKKKKKFKNR